MSIRPKTSIYLHKNLSANDLINKNSNKNKENKSEKAYLEFIKKDIIKPLTRRNIYSAKNFPNNNKNNYNNNLYKQYINNSNNFGLKNNSSSHWSLGTTLKSINWETIPKIQQFQKYYFPPYYNNKNIKEYRSFSLKTDHIGISDKFKQKNDSESFLKIKSEYSIQKESKEGWEPKIPKNNNLNNQNSVNYNIINFIPLNNYSKSCKNIFNRQKGIIEFADLNRVVSPNFNKEYIDLYKNNEQRFRKFNGIFTRMYDVTFKNGGFGKPFEDYKPKILKKN